LFFKKKISRFVDKIKQMEYIFPEFPRIAINPKVCTGKPHILGTRITVSSILAHLAGGMSTETMLEEFPRLKRADIYQALSFASQP
jgi:uncharacterized protein (DUF433 family)